MFICCLASPWPSWREILPHSVICFLTEDVSKLRWYSCYVTCAPSIDLAVSVIAEGLNVRTIDVLKGHMEVGRKQ